MTTSRDRALLSRVHWDYGAGVERRRLGVLILAAAVLAVLVPVGVQPRRVAGSPQPISAPGPPNAGDCVADPVTPTSWVNSQYIYPPLHFEACEGLRFGEVVGVIDHPAEAAATTGGDHSGSG